MRDILDRLKAFFISLTKPGNATGWKHLLKNLGMALGGVLVIVLIFFYMYLPWMTNHGESITVPDVVGKNLSQMEEFLGDRNLRYEVSEDSAYTSEQPPLTILEQFPLAESQVKENRKIYLVVNSRKPPLVSMPELVDKSLKMVPRILDALDLKMGKVTTKPDLALNEVLEQYVDGKRIEPGTKIPKGTSVDLVVGDGYGKTDFAVDQYINMPEDEAKIAILGQFLTIGRVTYVGDNQAIFVTKTPDGQSTTSSVVEVPRGYVVRQSPSYLRVVKQGDVIDLWVYDPAQAQNQ